MIVNETVIKEKFEQSDDELYEYLIDNAETDEQIEQLQRLQKLYEPYNYPNCAITQGDLEYQAYLDDQSRTLMNMGIDINRILG